jgi:hypothetical protein
LAVNNYLIIGVNPTNNETSVDLDTNIVVTFAQYMDASTVTSSTFVLKEVNGAIVPSTITYDSANLVVKINPTDNLQSGTEYQLDVIGGNTGVKTITGDTMGITRSYQFTTSFNQPLSIPTNVSATVDSGFVTVTWGRPAEYDPSLPVSYEVMVSTSNDPLQAPIWPSTGDVNKTGATVLNVPKKLTDSNYYAYVRALDGTNTSDWAFVQFDVQGTPASTDPTDSYGNPYGSGDTTSTLSFSFDVADTYPRRDDADIMPEQIVIVFSGDVDPTTINNSTVYLVKKKDKANLSLVDFMTEYAPSKAIPATIDTIASPNVVTLTATLDNDSEYTVIVRESVKDLSGTSLGIAYHWSFITTYTLLYGDVDKVREDLGVWGKNVADKILYDYLEDSTLYVNQLLPSMQNYDAKKYANGAAPYEVHEYVRFRAAYDALLNSNMRLGGGGFSQSVGLGDLHVSKGINDPALTISGILGQLKDKMKLYMDLIQGLHNRGYAKPQSVSKGEVAEAYPSYMTRDVYKAIG